MFQVKGSLRNSQNLFVGKKVLILPEVSHNFPTRNIYMSPMVISPRSCLSDHLSINTALTSPTYLKTSIANQSTLNSSIFSPRNRTTKIFNSKQKRRQSIRKLNSPIKQNFRIINYGPIKMCCVKPTPVLERKLSDNQLEQNSKKQQKIQSTVRFKQTREIQSKFEYQTSSLQQGRYYDSSEETIPHLDKTYITALASQISSQMSHSQIDGLGSNGSLSSRSPQNQYITYKFVENKSKNIIQNQQNQNDNNQEMKKQKEEPHLFELVNKLNYNKKIIYFSLAFAFSALIIILLLCLS